MMIKKLKFKKNDHLMIDSEFRHSVILIRRYEFSTFQICAFVFLVCCFALCQTSCQ
jgi:hypothetical protein